MDVGVPRCWNSSLEMVSAALVVDPQRGGQTVKRVGSHWIQAAQNRGIWNSLQKTYVRQWTVPDEKAIEKMEGRHHESCG
ncbi:jg14826 [Pararge aegeria aegeria]|uniref:Jg14826 protein n=1 Tax=Pararge aegeria aegeria TaxID=348720 RepID=A0A8S4RNM0_9NEOP|nr:jg14826 [Pararge aegeria aegeria]